MGRWRARRSTRSSAQRRSSSSSTAWDRCHALHQQPQQQQAQYQQAAAQQQHQGGVAHAPLLREGSLRGGLANLAGKVLNSPIDRLRRLSSGH